MGITVTTVDSSVAINAINNYDAKMAAITEARRDSERYHLGNRDAWFLDAVIADLSPDLPELIFTQGAGANPANPGDLTPGQCWELATAIAWADKEELESAVLSAYTPIDGDDSQDGIELVEEMAALAVRAVERGGLHVC
jgi:hypothetical protein